jgi:DNA-binding transcriptional LysR family regulator
MGASKMHNEPDFNWDDIRVFVAICRHGSTVAAGKALGVSQSTAQRRVAALEQSLSLKLVARTPTGYRLTSAGEEIRPFAERIETAMLDLKRHIQGASSGTGLIRVTCPEPVIQRLMPLMDRFQAEYSGLRVEFVISDRYLDLAQGEADVAFRSGDTDDELVGRKIAESVWAVYSSATYLERHGRPSSAKDLCNHALIAFEESMSGHRVSKWLAEVAPAGRIAGRSNSVLGLVSAVRCGIGIGPLPMAIADGEPDLIRVMGPIPELSRSWRLLAHPDLRRTPRVSAFFDFVLREKSALRSILTG